MTDTAIIEHYDRDDLEAVLLRALAAAGVDIDAVTVDDLAPADEFHLGGRTATDALLEQLATLGLLPDASRQVLDVGCGIGGPARAIAARTGCRVTGIDLTPSFVAAATALTGRVGGELAERVRFEVGNALALPFEAGSFDGAFLLHVGMNIADKAGLFASLGWVVRSGGFVAVYDVLRTADGDVTYPVPWAGSAAVSFPATMTDYTDALDAAGFDVVATRDRRAFALEFVAAARAAAQAAGGPPAVGLHLVLGSDAGKKTGNLVAALQAGVLAPTELIARRR